MNMKKYLTLLLTLVVTGTVSLRAQQAQEEPHAEPAAAQEEISTVFKCSPRATGYGVISNKFTTIDGNYVNMVEAYGGVYLNRRVLLGIGGAASTNNMPVPAQFSAIEGRELSYQYVQFGLFTEYVVASNKAIHPVFHLFAGPGLTMQYDRKGWEDFDDDDHESRDENWFMVVEPGVQLEINLFRWMRFSPGVSYRLAQGNDAMGLSNSKLSGASFNLSMKFGRF